MCFVRLTARLLLFCFSTRTACLYFIFVHELLVFLFFLVSFCTPGALSLAPNTIIKREEGEVEYNKGTPEPTPLPNIINNYFEKEEREVERKGIINICVCGLLIMGCIGYLFVPPGGGYVTLVCGLFATPIAAFIGLIGGLFGGLNGYIFAPIFGACTTHNKGLIGNFFQAPTTGAIVTIFIGYINGLSCPRAGRTTITIIGAFLCCFNGFDTDIGATVMAPVIATESGYDNGLFEYGLQTPNGVFFATHIGLIRGVFITQNTTGIEYNIETPAKECFTTLLLTEKIIFNV